MRRRPSMAITDIRIHIYMDIPTATIRTGTMAPPFRSDSALAPDITGVDIMAVGITGTGITGVAITRRLPADLGEDPLGMARLGMDPLGTADKDADDCVVGNKSCRVPSSSSSSRPPKIPAGYRMDH